MIRDYKSIQRHRKRSPKNGVLLAATALAVTVMAVKFVDLETIAATQDDIPLAQTHVSAALPLPEAENRASAASEQTLPQTFTAAPEPIDATNAAESAATADTVAIAVSDHTTADEQQANGVSLLSDDVISDAIVEQVGADQAIEATGPDAVIEEPEPELAQVAEPEQQWVDHVVARGESLAKIFSAQSLEPALLHRIVNTSEQGKTLANIRPGQKFRFLFDDQRELVRMELQRSRVDSVRVAITDDAVTIEEVSKDVEKRVATATGVIESSLFVDGQAAGLSDGKIMELAEIFGWDIDFALEIRAGDSFRVLFEEHYLDDEKLRDGPILAAEFTTRGTTYRAVRFEDSNGDIGYFDADGQSKRRAFIRTPIKFARVSSRYNPRRWHPILKKWRSHKGVDYAAPKGTPVKATGDGRIIFRGVKSGYGNVVIIEHASKYTTLYAHLNGFSKRAATGKRVKQGHVIGYVGKTGLASGPHLHYEFRVAGQHRDPLKVKLPKSLALPKSEIAAFHKVTAPLLAQLDAIADSTMVASASTTLPR